MEGDRLAKVRDGLEIVYTIVLIVVLVRESVRVPWKAMFWHYVARLSYETGQACYRGSIRARAYYWESVRQ